MKLKNIGYLERHFEKLLGGIAMIVIGLAVWYFGFNTPNIVEINHQKVTPAKVDQIVLTEAQSLQHALDSSHVADPLKNLKVPNYTQSFVTKLTQQPSSISEFELALGNPMYKTDGLEPTTPIENLPFVEPVIPTPALIAVRADMGAIDPAEVANNPDLSQVLLEKKAPFDTQWVSVVGQFNMAEMVKQLVQQPAANRRAIPPGWWNNSFAIVDVEMARQKQNPDGTWPPDKQFEIVSTMPGRVSFRKMPRELTGQQATAYFIKIKDYQDIIVQPPFYLLANNQTWQPPEPQQENAVPVTAGDIEDQKNELSRQIRVKTARVNIIQQQIQRLQNPGAHRPGAPAPRSGGLEGVTGESGPAGGASSGVNIVLQKRIDRLNEQFEKEKASLLDLQGQYAKLIGGNDNAAPGSRPTIDPRTGRPILSGEIPSEFSDNEFGPDAYPPGPAGTAPSRQSMLNMMGADTIDLWGTDLQVQPGATYRYRMRVAVINVLFNRPELPPDQFKAHAKKFLVDSAWSDWSRPVKTQRTQRFWVTSASPQPAPGHASFKVFIFHGGTWMARDFSVQPGDPIGQVVSTLDRETNQRHSVDFSTGAYLVDIDFDYPVMFTGNITRKTQRVLIMQDGALAPHRVDLERKDPELQKMINKLQVGVAEARP